MAGDWIKMEAATPEKQEVLAIAAYMGWDDPDYAVGKLFRVWRWFDQHTEDGNANGVTKALLDRISGVSGFATAMEKVGWLEEFDDGIRLPRFDKHCGETAKKRADTARRVAKHRSIKEESNGNEKSVTSALAREEKNREEKKKRKKEPMSGKPDESEQEAAVVLEYLNAKSGKAFKPVKANVSLILARIREGATLESLKAVVDLKVKDWRDDARMCQYLRPATLFNGEKFASYSGDLEKRSVGGFDWWSAHGFGSKVEAINAGEVAPS